MPKKSSKKSVKTDEKKISSSPDEKISSSPDEKKLSSSPDKKIKNTFTTEEIRNFVKIKIYKSKGKEDRTGKHQNKETLVSDFEKDLRSNRTCTLGCFEKLNHEDRKRIHYKDLFAAVEYDLEFYIRIAKQLIKLQYDPDVICVIPPNSKIFLDDLISGYIKDVSLVKKNFKVRSIFKTQERQVKMPQR
jgi:hypothetical protein